MKNTGKNSPQNKKNRQSDDTLLYILLLILFAALVGCLTWHFWPEKEPNYNYEKILGDKKTSPAAEEVTKLISENRSRLKTARRILEGKIEGRKLSKKERKEVENEFKNVEEGLEEGLAGFKIEELAENNPELLANIYGKLYEQGKVSVRLKDKTSVARPPEEMEKQLKIQEEWDIPKEEEKEITEEIKPWIDKWYWQAREELIDSGKYPLLAETITPVWENGEKIKGEPPRELINKYKELRESLKKDEETGKETKEVVDFSKSAEITFGGYYGFLTEEDKRDSSEGSEVFGLTKSNRLDGYYYQWGELDRETKEPIKITKDFYLFRADDKNHRKITIGFEKKMFFNRLGYEQWLNKKGSDIHYFDICFDEVVETMAHELAHAIVNTSEKDYRGEEGGGHGKLFYDIMRQIEAMIKNRSDFKEFETWWKRPREEQKEWAIDSILVKKSHWEKNKWWYIGGGAGVLVIGGFIGLILWDGGGQLSSKKNVKN